MNEDHESCIKMNQHFPEPYEHSDGNVKCQLDLPNYVRMADLKGAAGVDTSRLVSKTELAGLKTKVDKLKTVPTDLSKLCNVVDNDVLKKTVCNQLVTKVNAIDTKIQSTKVFVAKTQQDLDKQGLEKKIEDVAQKIPNNSQKDWLLHKNKEIESKISSVTGLVNTAALNTKVADWKWIIWYL